MRPLSPLSNSQFVGRFEWRTTAPADDCGTVATSQRIIYLLRAVGAVKGSGPRLRRRVLRIFCHEEENCSIEQGLLKAGGMPALRERTCLKSRSLPTKSCKRNSTGGPLPA